MHWRPRVAAAVALAGVFATAAVAPAQAPSGDVPKLDAMTQQQWEALPDSQVIDVKGNRMTKGELRAQTGQARGEAMARGRQLARSSVPFTSRREQFLTDARVKLDTENARLRAEFDRRRPAPGPAPSPRRELITKEARELLGRSRNASPPELARIERRAAELLKELQQPAR